MEIELDQTDYEYILLHKFQELKDLREINSPEFYRVFDFVSRDWTSMQRHDFLVTVGARIVIVGQW